MVAPGPLVIVTGPPASGKSTAIRGLLERWPNLSHFGVRRFIGGEIHRQTRLGARAVELSKRRWLPDQFVIEMFATWLNDHREASGWLVESFPRSRSQLRLLEACLAGRGLRVSCVLLFDAPDELLIARAAQRLVCLSCDGQIVEVVPIAGSACPICNAELVRRKDDAHDFFLDRIRAHRAAVPELLAAYGEIPVHRIDGSKSPLGVTRQAIAAVDPYWPRSARYATARRAIKTD